ncbi:hypothetical protein ABZ896_16555 [Streptomyces sp. NPDC047072]|uniref:hypothetical protein n=1 Tax=Streptomyces sp. NPDC047072 TaxID=3154809 RepID=UPI00340F5466
MGQLPPLLFVLAGIAVVLGLFVALARRIRRRGTGGGALRGALAAYDEAFHGTAADAYQEIRVQTDRRGPLPDDRNRWRPRDR